MATLRPTRLRNAVRLSNHINWPGDHRNSPASLRKALACSCEQQPPDKMQPQWITGYRSLDIETGSGDETWTPRLSADFSAQSMAYARSRKENGLGTSCGGPTGFVGVILACMHTRSSECPLPTVFGGHRNLIKGLRRTVLRSRTDFT